MGLTSRLAQTDIPSGPAGPVAMLRTCTSWLRGVAGDWNFARAAFAFLTPMRYKKILHFTLSSLREKRVLHGGDTLPAIRQPEL